MATTSRKRRIPAKRRAARRRPGTGGQGGYFRIEVRPGEKFATYRIQTVGRAGHTKRLAGRRTSGGWSTKSWLVRKTDAHVERNKLVIDDRHTRTILKAIRGPLRHIKGDIFRALPRRDIPEREKPTPAMRRAQLKNIKKAQRARRRGR